MHQVGFAEHLNRRRLLVMLLGPLPIVAASLALTNWWRTGGPRVVSGNHVLHADEPPAEATGPAATAPPASEAGGPLEAECRQAAEELRPRLGTECAVIVRPPFVVAGDMIETELVRWHDQTIAPACRCMAKCYFRTPPTQPITVLLFSGEDSYNRYAKQLFGEEGVSVYGYYKADRRTLVMNIDTGGGTLVHELTHALVNFDFPEVPDWFNEGLASLHEHCRFLPDEAGLEGLPNWRLPKLQEAIREGRLEPLERMIAGDDFRGANVGANYAQARYFCMYLQRQKLLEEYYRRFREARRRDPRGSATLRGMFDDETWSRLDRDFQAWVLTLRY